MPAPGQFFPRKSSAHRIACTALYRALLKQCARVPLPNDFPLRGKTHPIKHFIQRAFKKNVYHTSPRLIVPALETGYAVHSLLHHASSSPAYPPNPALIQLHGLLRTLSTSYQPVTLSSPPKLRRTRPRITSYPGAPKVVDIRPLPKEKLTGRRHVPKLVGIHGIYPFLRIKKPQSPFISRIFRTKIKRKQRRYTRIDEMEGLKEMGEWEDIWDKAIEDPGAVDRDGGGRDINGAEVHERRDKSSSWSAEVGEMGTRDENGNENVDDTVNWWDSWGTVAEIQRRETWRAINEDGKQAKELGERMAEIVEQEKKLWEEERIGRRHLKNQEKMQRKIQGGAKEKPARSDE
ncbi:hypothetical protein EG329_009188 [Mollisiaceae sp. DMI_Dod_QoI]|nr:hypothetical protein EG329_009188 [Helotiales sp. DMI_Dod_QoI]